MARKPGRTYRTSSGKSVDFGALLLANETAPAIGNMNVNARGDEIDTAGNITKSREQIMREYNELNTMVPNDDAIPEGTGITADDDWQDWEPPQMSQPIADPAPIQPVVPTPPPPPPPEPIPTPPPVEEPKPTVQLGSIATVTPEATPAPTPTPAPIPTPTPAPIVKQTEKKPMSVAQMVEANPDRVIDNTIKRPSGGLAAAVAAAKEVEDTTVQPEHIQNKNTPGVKRI